MDIFRDEKSLIEKLKPYLLRKGEPGQFFDPFLNVLTQMAKDWIRTEASSERVWPPEDGVLNGGALQEQLLKASKRILIGEMSVCKAENRLSGDREEAEYQSYVCDWLLNPAYLEELFQRYPLWEESIVQILTFYVRNVLEIVRHLNSDMENLNACFFQTNPFKKVKGIKGSGSDVHCGNRMVFKVELDNGENLYYKPRAGRGVSFFNDLYEAIGQAGNLPVFIPSALMGRDYVWEREVGYAACHSEAEVQNYFKRFGILLGICQFCHTSDMHYENIIACGEYPVVIDFETLVQVPIAPEIPEFSELDRRIQMSVLTNGLLPFFGIHKADIKADFSGIWGGEGQVLNFKMPEIQNPGRSDMKIGYVYAETRRQQNRVQLDGQEVKPSDYGPQIVEGFRLAYGYITQHAETIRQKIQGISSAWFRQLVRNTQEYQMILDLSFHPEFMKNQEIREGFLKDALAVSGFQDRTWIIEQEIRDLLKGDIPYFQFQMSGSELWNSEKKAIGPYFPETGLEFLEKQLQSRGKEDLEFQERLIRMALNYANVQWLQESEGEPRGRGRIDREAVLKLCRAAADQVWEGRLSSDNGDSWIHTHILPTARADRFSYCMQPSDIYLYDGLMGIAVFTAAFLKWAPDHSLAGLYEDLVRQLFDYTDAVLADNGEKRGTGIFCGEASMVYGYELLWEITGRQIFLDYGRKHCKIVESHLADDDNYDIIGGNAGAVLAFLNFYDRTGEEEYLDMAVKAADYLCSRSVAAGSGIGWPNGSNGTALAGFAHGNSGILYALMQLYARTKKDTYKNKAFQAFLYERELYCPERGWLDLRCADVTYLEDFKWCHGSGGILLSRIKTLEWFGREQQKMIKADIQQLISETLPIAFRKEMGLCHGNLGNLLLLRLMTGSFFKAGGDICLEKTLQSLKIGCDQKRPEASLYEQYDFGLMTGWAGIGYGLLCLIDEGLPPLLDGKTKTGSDKTVGK